MVDNDPGETARDYVSGLADEHPVVRYVAEPGLREWRPHDSDASKRPRARI